MATTRYPQELRERAVRMVFEHRREYPSEWAAIRSLAEKFGTTPETLRLWVRRAEVDGGRLFARVQRLIRLQSESRRDCGLIFAIEEFTHARLQSWRFLTKCS